jgi:hypothetical protein
MAPPLYVPEILLAAEELFRSTMEVIQADSSNHLRAKTLFSNSFAYWGVMNNNFTIAQQAHKQIKAYRDLMRDPATGFWRHVTSNGQWEGMFTFSLRLAIPLLIFP